MDTLNYNIRYGFIDGLVRAYFTGFLTENDYMQLKQSETLDDLRLHLGNCGFQEYFQNDTGSATPQIIYERCMQRMVQRFNDIECQAESDLKTFFQWIRIPFMIDNVVLLISGIVRNRDVTDLVERCHPLGMFDGIKSLSVAANAEELYQTVLIDTPLGPLFQKCLSKTTLNEQNVEIIRLMLYREYFDGFYKFCEGLGNETANIMLEILKFEADRRAIIITLNSLKTSLMFDDREALYPRIGQLYPEATHLLVRAQTEADVARILDSYEVYRGLWGSVSQTNSIEDVFYERMAEMNVDSFNIFFQFGVFYAWVHLMDQEVRNIQWISECIHQNKREKADSYIRIRK
ncbi:V-type proton ATPase subunit d 2 [Histomonas meleagridis]|uniref:V-type proton ATPase subunit d 2 n=1 Tax=Histomonas meleagridis TaxID=135588 RepID=UPI003559FDD3|nr:V-type proton ATPase subunit d 2 [Histomonas meleagridis]KAH0801480.1 V-type proton ATPase subunit d 2 [Histomonas meleagridis]